MAIDNTMATIGCTTTANSANDAQTTQISPPCHTKLSSKKHAISASTWHHKSNRALTVHQLSIHSGFKISPQTHATSLTTTTKNCVYNALSRQIAQNHMSS